ncbi:hypothetical protein SAMN05444004_10823 [Jannaschia faecimaris]|uniref:Uncharacterized protein n=2 Tax=Jannaschia faecimaris TaxID=1244108 RepID=A0A1H3R9D3_9RHOB|nr:hypothetical protein SAMN05444004_10823 [Jannaschia faecimaris]
MGLPPGDALFSSDRDARNFDAYADRFATIDCRGLNASRAALRAQAEKSGSPGTGLVAGAIGALIGGPAGALAKVIGTEASQLVAKSGNVRLAAAEAVYVAKSCDNPGGGRGQTRPTTPVRTGPGQIGPIQTTPVPTLIAATLPKTTAT